MSIRILLVEDFEPWRRFVCSMVEKEPEMRIICEVSDGLVAVDKARELKPDLILLDIGLPSLNGLEVARQTSKAVPETKNTLRKSGIVSHSCAGSHEDRVWIHC